LHGSCIDGIDLPTFREWVVQRHGSDYWRNQFEDMFDMYTNDIFREHKPFYNLHNQLIYLQLAPSDIDMPYIGTRGQRTRRNAPVSERRQLK
jgi:hypothetical protein